MQVLKFGGTSVQDLKSIESVVSIITKRDKSLIIVVSAMAGITNTLIELFSAMKKKHHKKMTKLIYFIRKRHLEILEAKNINSTQLTNDLNDFELFIQSVCHLAEFSQQSEAKVITFGDRLAAFTLSVLLREKISSNYLDSADILKSDENYLNASIDLKHTSKNCNKILLPLFKTNRAILIPGFSASTSLNQVTALGRGGSDYTASCLAYCMNVETLEIWTDVDGIMTCDPRRINEAKPVRQISYLEAEELAYFGGKVLDSRTIQPAFSKQIPISIRNTKNLNDTGTSIVPEIENNNHFKAITCKTDITVITIHSNRMLGAYGFLSKVFSVFEVHKTSIDLIATSEVSISLTIDNTYHLKPILKSLKSFSSINLDKNMAIISLIGEGVKHQSGVAADFFSILRRINISMISLGASEVNLSIVLNQSDLDIAISILHNHFFLKLDDSSIFNSRKERV